MPLSWSGAIVIDATTVSFLLMTLAGALGLARGVRAEGITLAGLLATAAMITSEATAARLASLANNVVAKAARILDLFFGSDDAIPSPGELRFIATDDQRLIFSFILFVLLAAIFYLVGSALGGNPVAAGQRLVGGILGVVSGLVVSLTFINLNQSWVGRHGDLGEIAINIPLVISPRPPEANPFAPYLPLVLLSALIIIVALALIFLARSRKVKP